MAQCLRDKKSFCLTIILRVVTFELTIDVLGVHTEIQLMILIPWGKTAQFMKFETKVLVADAYNQTSAT